MAPRSYSPAFARRLLLACALTAAPSVTAPALAQAIFIPSQAAPAPLGGAMVTGRVTGLTEASFQLALRGGHTIAVHLHPAQAKHLLPPAVWLGEFVHVQGKRTGAGSITALAVTRAKSAPAFWPADTQ